MGNGYNQHLNLQQLNHKATFLPMLCSKPSIKDVTLPNWKDRCASSLSESDDPLSPKISCMGHVKRNNRILIGFPAASHKLTFTTTNTKNSCNNNNNNNNGIKYFKLKKLFSGKNLTRSSPSATTSTTVTGCRRREVLINSTIRAKNGDGKENSASNIINIENMDPPLPVIKRVVPKNGEKGDGDTLWDRRSRGVALKSLQLQQIQLNQEPTTV